MLFRLSRVSFWLAAAAAALALLAPGGRETLLTGVVLVASLTAFGLWRSGVRQQQRAPATTTALPEPVVLTQDALREAAAMLVRQADEAASFADALHAVARVLRGELGARQATVCEVRGIDAIHAQVADLIEASPGFRAKARPVRLDATPLGQAIRTGVEAGAPPGGVAVPVLASTRVVAVIELSGFDVPVEPPALAGLLRLARLTLSRLAPAGPAALCVPQPSTAPQQLHGDVLVIEDMVVQPELTARMLRRMGCRVTPASGMLDALKALGRTQFDLILVDLQVAGVSGAEGLSRLRQGCAAGSAAAAGTPVIAITGPGLPGDTQRFRELGFDDHVCKPFRHNQMLALLSTYLRLHAPAEPRESGAAAFEPTAAHASAESTPVLDPVALARLTELDPTGENHLLQRVLQAFRASVARLRPQADAARLSGDQAGLRLVAHTLKSSSASIGAMHLSQLCAQIETMIRTASGENLEAHLDMLNAELDGVLVAIDQLLKERA